MAGLVTFPVTTTGIANGTYPVTLNAQPGVASLFWQDVNITINAGSGTFGFTSKLNTPAGTYNIRITFDGTESNDFTLTVDPPACVAPTIDSGGQPTNQTVAVGGTATFSVSASGTTPLTYYWYVDNGSGKGWGQLMGETSATLTIPVVTAAMNGYKYYCYISNDCGNVSTITVTLTVN